MLHGLKDQIAQQKFAKELFDRIPGNKKKMFIYPNGFHELFNDTESSIYKNDLISFFGDVLKNNPPSLGTSNSSRRREENRASNSDPKAKAK